MAGATFVAAGHDIVAAATGDQIVAGYFKVDQDQQRVARCHVYRIDASCNNEIFPQNRLGDLGITGEQVGGVGGVGGDITDDGAGFFDEDISMP